MLKSMTVKQLERLDANIYGRIERAFCGGTRYGIDWPTLWAVLPGFAVALKSVRRELRSRMFADYENPATIHWRR